MLLRDLTIENYRSFEKYKLDGLARVNLLVGDNNCGKTSLLEAGYILSCRGDSAAIASVLDERGDTTAVEERGRVRQPVLVARLPSLFGTKAGNNPLDCRFDLEATGFGQLAVCLMANSGLAEYAANSKHRALLLKHPEAFVGDPNDRIVLSHHIGNKLSEKLSVQLLTREGYLELDRFRSSAIVGGNSVNQPQESTSCFISTRSLAPELLKNIWAGLLKSSQESRAIEAVRIVLPELSGIVFLPESYSTPGTRADVLLEFNKERRSLAGFGEGVSRLLSLGATLGASQSGQLFIDEIDSGLHYSKLSDMWRMVVKAAGMLDVQVFATTHSLDCIRALEAACDGDESLRDDVALFSIDRRMDEAVRYGGDELSAVVEHEIEVR